MMTSITMAVEPMVIVKVENDFSKTVREVFYDAETLKKLHEENWSLEIFWFPFNSFSWLELMVNGMLDWKGNDNAFQSEHSKDIFYQVFCSITQLSDSGESKTIGFK